MKTTLGVVEQVDAGVLNVGYVEAGEATGQPVVLLHGWPYDIHSYADVTPILEAAGYRVIVPFSTATEPLGSWRTTRCGTANNP